MPAGLSRPFSLPLPQSSLSCACSSCLFASTSANLGSPFLSITCFGSHCYTNCCCLTTYSTRISCGLYIIIGYLVGHCSTRATLFYVAGESRHGAMGGSGNQPWHAGGPRAARGREWLKGACLGRVPALLWGAGFHARDWSCTTLKGFQSRNKDTLAASPHRAALHCPECVASFAHRTGAGRAGV